MGVAREVELTRLDGTKEKETIETVRIVGRGAFGLVSEVRTGRGSRALKMVYQDARYVNRELDVLLSIAHPNIMGLHGFYVTHRTARGSYLNMVLDYMPVVLEDYIAANKGMATETARGLMAQTLEALRYLHGRGIAHRDLKPCNIVLDNAQRLKLCDLGSAKTLGTGTQSVAYICSRYYRAPENLLGCTDYSVRVDVWAAGAIFCEFGIPGTLFKRDNGRETLRAIVEAIGDPTGFARARGCDFDLPDEAAAVPGIAKMVGKYFKSSELVDVLVRMLVLDPNVRFDAADLLEMPFFK